MLGACLGAGDVGARPEIGRIHPQNFSEQQAVLGLGRAPVPCGPDSKRLYQAVGYASNSKLGHNRPPAFIVCGQAKPSVLRSGLRYP